jgi:hypothetical protein
MRSWPLLFQIDVTHAYYADARDARLAIAPAPGSAEWLAARGCIARPSGARLSVYRPAPADEPQRGARSLTFPVTLAFDYRSLDPLFLAVTDPLEAVYALGAGPAGERPGPVGPPPWLDASAKPPTFRVEVTLALDPGAAPPTFELSLPARKVVWTYLLAGDWPDDAIRIVAAGPQSDGAAGFAAAEEKVVLADGRSAIALSSTEALALTQRPTALQLMAGDRALIRNLPGADPANLAFAPGPPPSLTCEIFLCR